MESGVCFKSIVLTNAESLTTDAQSALRRCIEQFSHNTRFFVVINEKSRLLKPILSRFCEIYVPIPTIKGSQCNLHKHSIDKCFDKSSDTKKAVTWINTNILNNAFLDVLDDCICFTASTVEPLKDFLFKENTNTKLTNIQSIKLLKTITRQIKYLEGINYTFYGFNIDEILVINETKYIMLVFDVEFLSQFHLLKQNYFVLSSQGRY